MRKIKEKIKGFVKKKEEPNLKNKLKTVFYEDIPFSMKGVLKSNHYSSMNFVENPNSNSAKIKFSVVQTGKKKHHLIEKIKEYKGKNLKKQRKARKVEVDAYKDIKPFIKKVNRKKLNVRINGKKHFIKVEVPRILLAGELKENVGTYILMTRLKNKNLTHLPAVSELLQEDKIPEGREPSRKKPGNKPKPISKLAQKYRENLVVRHSLLNASGQVIGYLLGKGYVWHDASAKHVLFDDPQESNKNILRMGLVDFEKSKSIDPTKENFNEVQNKTEIKKLIKNCVASVRYKNNTPEDIEKLIKGLKKGFSESANFEGSDKFLDELIKQSKSEPFKDAVRKNKVPSEYYISYLSADAVLKELEEHSYEDLMGQKEKRLRELGGKDRKLEKEIKELRESHPYFRDWERGKTLLKIFSGQGLERGKNNEKLPFFNKRDAEKYLDIRGLIRRIRLSPEEIEKEKERIYPIIKKEMGKNKKSENTVFKIVRKNGYLYFDHRNFVYENKHSKFK